MAVAFSLLFVDTIKTFMEGVEKGEHVSFLAVLVSLTTIKGFHIFCLEFQLYLQNKTNSLMSNALSLQLFKELLSGSVLYKEKIHLGDALNRLTTNVSDVSNCLTETIHGLIYSFVQLLAICIYLTSIEPALTVMIILIMPAAIVLGQVYAKKSLPVSREI